MVRDGWARFDEQGGGSAAEWLHSRAARKLKTQCNDCLGQPGTYVSARGASACSKKYTYRELVVQNAFYAATG